MPMDHEKSAWIRYYGQALPHNLEAAPHRGRHRKLLWRLMVVVLATGICSWALPGQHAGPSVLEVSRDRFDWYAVRCWLAFDHLNVSLTP